MSEKTAVIYASKYGSTEKYAKMIAHALNADLFPIKQVKTESLFHYDRLIFGGGLYAGNLSGIRNMRKLFSSLKEKEIIIFSVGLMETTEENVRLTIEQNFPDGLPEHIKFYALRGGYDYQKLTLVHKMMMHVLKKFLIKKGEEMTENDKLIVKSFQKSMDFIENKNILPIIHIEERGR